MTGPDPFTVLGLPARPDLTDEQVRTAWRAIAAATHPDRPGGGNPAAYAAASAAYATLRTPWGRSRGIRRPHDTPAGTHAARPRGGSRCVRRPLAAAGPGAYPARPPAAAGRPHPGRRVPGPDRRPVGSRRPRSGGSRRRAGPVGGGDRAGGPRPAPRTVNPDGCSVRGGRDAVDGSLGTWHGAGPSERAARPSKSGRPDRPASPPAKVTAARSPTPCQDTAQTTAHRSRPAHGQETSAKKGSKNGFT